MQRNMRAAWPLRRMPVPVYNNPSKNATGKFICTGAKYCVIMDQTDKEEYFVNLQEIQLKNGSVLVSVTGYSGETDFYAMYDVI